MMPWGQKTPKGNLRSAGDKDLAVALDGAQPRADQQPNRERQLGDQRYEVGNGYDHRLIAG